MTKQEKINSLEEELAQAYKQIEELRQDADKSFRTSPEYIRMEQDIKVLKMGEALAKRHIETEIKSNKRLMSDMQKLLEDNRNLCGEHDVEYWIGITQTDRFANKEFRDYEKKITDLEVKLAAKDVIIEHYKDLLAGRDPKEPKETVMGRRPIPEEQKKRVRSYRKKGFTLKEIAEMEGLSIGAVSGICKGIKNAKKVDHKS